MAKDQSKRLNPAYLEADRSSFAALQAITNYTPANPAYALAKITAAQAELDEAQRLEAQTAAAAAAARDNTMAKEWEFHNLVLGAKDQVVAQFGRDSNEVQSVGLKKASEYKDRRRKQDSEQPLKPSAS
ncbi:MAG TPA: hypothetical protein VGV38_22725 [Pyrinomonadaceae bacterium]|nr:hypothetical protein [Pyrinomonadaceae bacterium]